MTTIPLNDLQRMYAAYGDKLDQTALDVLRSGWWLNGPRNKAFCEAFAGYLGVGHFIGLANGTDALEIVLRVLLEKALRSGSVEQTATRTADAYEVITVANAGGYTSTACYLVGCTPVYADIEPESQLLSIPSAVAALSGKTVAVVATHLYGGLIDVPALRRAMNDAGYAHVPIVEDCAQAHGLKGASGTAGTFGDIATFSFYPTKNLGALGDGGGVATSDADLNGSVRRLQQYGWGDKYNIVAAGGRNSRLDELQAAFLSVLLSDLDSSNARRVSVLDAYEKAAPVGLQIVRSRIGTVAHLAVIQTGHREQLKEYLKTHGVATDIHYPVLDCDQPGWGDRPKRIGPSGLDVSRVSVNRILTLPCFPTMTEEEVARVCNALSAFTPR
ncbi:DegT/DnrJ/EryC1/StrS family aminotransferase [Microvirga terrae]|uniref:DegT/DnrJ/EryC1/StrS family aminotransferase n=1 Tax=Microvirga terrae TaxID=2740529 RepID=A0ABY5RMB4_9HYPH|nr:DegT/DnrJ/EryC1/StrS family aminotransferase [Microvirga terrae]UVF18361.1 DegT/DnrJ/EryC1/StrS family aminotransferase [Microvirga terrae]